MAVLVKQTCHFCPREKKERVLRFNLVVEFGKQQAVHSDLPEPFHQAESFKAGFCARHLFAFGRPYVLAVFSPTMLSARYTFVNPITC